MLKGFVSGEEKDIVRIPMKVSNEYKEGWEVRDNQDRLIWGREDELQTTTGTLPFKGYSLPLKVKSLLGNAVQNGTPAPDNIIIPEMCGVRTGNLFDPNGITTNERGETRVGVELPAGRYCITNLSNSVCYWRIGVETQTSNQINPSAPYVYINAPDTLVVWVDTNSNKNIMLNAGSTALPYEPYGWKVPFTNAGQTIPVYLGGVPTVRRVKKLVLDGTESYTYQSQYSRYVFTIQDAFADGTRNTQCFCTHYQSVHNGEPITDVPDNSIYINQQAAGTQFCIKDESITSADDFKSYLTAQYAAGTPVTIWYVLKTPETTISNEPLCKISTYADELTTIQVHGLSAPLYGIGDYKDTLNLSTGVVTRKVKKLVLTGEENVENKSGNAKWYIPIADMKTPASTAAIEWCCSHYQAVANNVSWTSYDYMISWSSVDTGSSIGLRIRDVDFSTGKTVADFKSYLSAQYAAGTPVTVWYALAEPETETVTVPTGMTGEIEGYLTQVSTPTPTNRSVPKWNGVEETGGTYAVTVYTPPEIPTTTGENTLTVDTTLAPSKLEVSVHAKKIHYGFKIDKSNDNSEDAVIYTHDAVTMTPAHMDFANDRFDYGSWGNAFFVRDCYPVALNLDGTEAYRLDPDDYTKKMDGTASDIFYELLTEEPSDWSTQWKQYYTKSGDEYVLNSQSEAPTFTTDTYYKLTYTSSFTGNFMMAFPKVWFYRHEDSKYNYIEISNHRLSDDWKCYAHINANGQEVDFIYLPLFKGVIKDSKLRSLPGQIPQGNTTATTEANAATALGSRWQIWDHSSVECLNDLLTLMSKSIDSQGRFGQGRSTGYDSTDTVTYGKLQSGTLIKKGKFHGYSATTKEVKVFGIEGFWANRLDRLQGMLLVNNVWKIKMTPPYNFTGTDFVTLSNAEVPSGNGYLSKVQTSEYGSIPASIANGSSTKYFKDYFYKTATDTRVALRGGGCNSGGYAGFRYVIVNSAASNSSWHIGASPVYK